MQHNTGQLATFCSLAALLVALAVGGAWIAEDYVGALSWVLRLSLLGGVLALALVAMTLGLGRQINNQSAVQRHFELLCRIEQGDLLRELCSATVPQLPGDDSWHETSAQVHACLTAFQDKLREAEEARAVAEVRARRLADEHDHLSEIVSSLSDPVLAVDQYDELVLANESAKSLFDLGGQSPEQRSIRALVRCEELVGMLGEIRRRRTSSQRTSELELNDADGRPRTYSLTVRQVGGGERITASGTQPGAVAILHDISHLKAIQERNAEFVAAVSHEMKTPLAGIKAYVELLADGDAEDDKTRGEFLHVINTQADRLQRLIDNLLNLARIEAGVVHVHKKTESLNELLEESLQVVQPAAAEKSIALDSDLSQLHLSGLIDRDMILQAAINLLSNAVKYTAAGGRVTLRSRMTDHEIEFEVEDTGVGLSLEDCTKVFDKFYRVNKDKHMASGTGLGLPLAKHIVEDVHGGRLTLSSVLGQGSTFRVTLPSLGSANKPAGPPRKLAVAGK